MNSSSAATKQAWKAALEKAIVKHGGPQVMDKLMDRCVDQGCVDGMQALVDRGCKVYKDHLYAAATPGHLGAVEFICNFFKDMPKSEQKAHHERHVDDDEDDYNSAGTCLFEWIVDGTSAFDSAIEMGHFEVVKYIIKCYGGGLPVADMNVWAYQTAFEHKHYEMGIYLCDFEQKHVDEDLDEDDEEDSCYEGFWPFYYIVETEFDPALFQILIDRKLLGVDDVSTLGNTMLHLACRLNNKKMLDLFLEAGADVCTKNSDGKSPVDEACDMLEERRRDLWKDADKYDVEIVQPLKREHAWKRRASICMIRDRATKHVEKKSSVEKELLASFIENVPEGVFRNIVGYL